MCKNSTIIDFIDLYALPLTIGVTCLLLFNRTVQDSIDSNIMINLSIIFIIVYVLDRLITKFRETFTCRSFI